MTMTSASVRESVSRARSAAVGACTTSTPSGAGTATFAASSVTSAPRRRGLARDRDAHPPARAVPEIAHRVERLAGAARRDDDALPLERAGPAEQLLAAREDRRPARSSARCRPRPRRARLPRARSARRRARAAVSRWPASPGAPTCGRSSPARPAAGPRKASASWVRTLSASPCASFASVFAESGAMTSRSASTRCG